MKELRNELIGEEEVNENEIKELFNYTKVLKSVKTKSEKTRFGVLNFFVIEIEGIAGSINLKCSEDVIRMVRTFSSLGEYPFVKKELVKEENSSNKTYVCLRLVTPTNKVFRYFISRADVDSIELAYKKYIEKQENKK